MTTTNQEESDYTQRVEIPAPESTEAGSPVPAQPQGQQRSEQTRQPNTPVYAQQAPSEGAPVHGQAAYYAPSFPPAEEFRPQEAHAGEASSPTDVLYVPLAVTVGDGFKFGCGFFMAAVIVMLIGFVLTAAMFAITSLMGINLPVGR